MEIGPIPGIRAVPAVKASQPDYRPPAVFDVDSAAKPGEGGERGNKRKAAGAEESDEEEWTLENDEEEPMFASGAESGEETPGEVPSRQVDYFA